MPRQPLIQTENGFLCSVGRHSQDTGCLPIPRAALSRKAGVTTMKTAITTLIIVMLQFCHAADISAGSSIKALVGGNVINPTGARSVENAVVVIENNRIVQVGRSGRTEIPDGAEIIMAEGKWIIPGLIDSHIHFFQSGGIYTRPDIIDLTEYVPYVEGELAQLRKRIPDTLARYLRCGITTVVDMGGPFWNFEIRQLAREMQLAPRVAVAGPLISTYQPEALTTNDPPIMKVDTVEEARALVNSQIERRTDFIKIWYIVLPGHEPKEYFQLVKATIDESHKHGVPVIVHATELETAKAAVRAGADILAHGVGDRLVDEEFIRLLKERNIIYSTTIIVHEGYMEALSKHVRLTGIEHELANPHVVSTLFDLYELPEDASPAIDDQRISRTRERIELNQKNLRMIHEAGVTVAANTDAGNIGTLHGAALFREFELMSEAGLSPMEILTAATINNAKLMRQQDELGTIEQGKLADIVVLNSDPLRNILNTSDIHLVIKDGTVLKPQEIIEKTAEDVVQQQVNAYNARDIEAFLATYSPGIELYDHPTDLRYAGLEEMREGYLRLFESTPELHVQVVCRITLGNYVIDREKVTGLSDDGLREAVAIYLVKDGLIQKVWLIKE